MSYLASTGALKTMLAATLPHHAPSHAPSHEHAHEHPGEGHVEGTKHQAVVRRVNDLGLRFIHQFPGEPAAQAVWGRILRATFLQDSRAPSAAPLRRKIGTVGLVGGGGWWGRMCGDWNGVVGACRVVAKFIVHVDALL